ncbi:MAG: NAD-dependent epimerase/dehydratase family protein [Actinomycetota bacterium]|nr:NAD-dependent epimerase/dehydratase family protein [Actinomycetota bacterium]
MNAFVTGATGFIGGHLAARLASEGFSVKCLVRRPTVSGRLAGLAASVIQGDCTRKETLREAVRGADYIFHLAGVTKAKKAGDFYRANAEGTRNLLEATAENNPGCRMFVYVSSLSASGPSPDGSLRREDEEPAPVSDYGRSKLLGEKAVEEFAKSIPTVIVRPPAVYGPGDRDFLVLFRMVAKGVYPYWGESSYSLVFVEDLVAGIIQAATSQTSAGKIYNLSDGPCHKGSEIAAAISEALGKRRPPLKLRLPSALVPVIAGISGLMPGTGIVNRDKARELAYSHWCCDTGKAGRDFGFAAKTTLKEGIKWTADWYRTHQWL